MIRRRFSLDVGLRYGFLLAILAVWLVASQNLPQYLMPSPATVLADIGNLLTGQGFRRHILATIQHILFAIGISFGLAFVLVMLARGTPLFAVLIEARLTPLANAFPAIGWTFLAMIWFGIGPTTVIFVISAMLLPFNIINISQGLRGMNDDLLEMAASFTGNPLRRFALVVFPMLAPFLFATLRLNFGVSWKVALTAELLGGNRGLGFLMNLAMQDQDTTRLLSISLMIVVFVWIMDAKLLAAVQDRFDRRYV